ncbi:LAQU0S01e10616g1_1 [Lachancea quebecensis]|uniref:Class E vacuolar protein-sorting machinery protein HSE1 n=1 Tax=Lachancea quebecensis TaxID=1654605 RepID=A0A0P1KMJ1_9SACH|nr:LAQU0S01e10616g1_1 [Lachancea quebecensis]
MSSNQSLRDAILRATDGKLRVDNWQFIIEVCDLVRDDPEDRGRLAIDIVEERLKEDDANVVLRTLSLVVSLAENCGSRLQQAISSKGFTKVLYGLIENPKVHLVVKTEVAKVVEQLSDSFKRDSSLKSMEDLYMTISTQAPHLLVQEKVPQKKEMSTETKRNEEKELEEALKLSILEYEQSKSQNMVRNTENKVLNLKSVESTDYSEPQSQTAVRKVRALHDLAGRESDELSFRKGDIIVVIEQVYRDWWRGRLRGRVGIFPLNYVTPVAEKTLEQQRQQKANEEAVFSQARNVDRLHKRMIDSANDPELTQDEEVNNLYSVVTPLRPQLTKMIGDYAQKKEEYSSLRKVLADAEASYNRLLDGASQANSVQRLSPERIGNGTYSHPVGLQQAHEPHAFAVSASGRRTVSGGPYVHAQSFLTGQSQPNQYPTHSVKLQQSQQHPSHHQDPQLYQQGSPNYQQQPQNYQQQPQNYQQQPQNYQQQPQNTRPSEHRPAYQVPYPVSNQGTGI